MALRLANVLLSLQVLGKPQQFACIVTPQRRAARARCVLCRLCCALRLKRCAILRHSSSIYFALEAHGFCFSVVATRATCTTASALIATAGALQSGGAPRFIVCVSMQAFAHVDKDTYRTLGNRARANIMHMSSYPLRCLLVSAYARVLHCAAHAIARAGCTTSSLCNGRVCQKKRTKNRLKSIRKMVLILVFNPAPQIVEVLCNTTCATNHSNGRPATAPSSACCSTPTARNSLTSAVREHIHVRDLKALMQGTISEWARAWRHAEMQ